MKSRTLALTLLVGMLVGCVSLPPSPHPPGINVQEGQAAVETLEVVMLMSFPLQVHLHVTGYVADPCTEIDEIVVAREGNSFEVSIAAKRDPHVECIQVIEPFELNIPLYVYGLPAGEYSVWVNGVAAEFSFNQDNLLSE